MASRRYQKLKMLRLAHKLAFAQAPYKVQQNCLLRAMEVLEFKRQKSTDRHTPPEAFEPD